MNNISVIRFEHCSIKVSKNDCGGIERVCLNDVCNILKRHIFLMDGTAVHKCPSATIIDDSRPREIYAEFGETIQFIRWMCMESKILALTGRRLLEFLQESQMLPLVNPALGPSTPPLHTAEAEEVMELEYAGNKFTMRMCNGRYMVNATQMARPFDKRPNVWLKTTEAVRLRKALVDDGRSRNLESQVIATRGSHGATWLDVHLWRHFAQWLSPAFASWCSKQIVPLMKNKHINLADEQSPDNDVPEFRSPRRGEDLDFTDEGFLPIPEDYEMALSVIEHQKNTIRKQREFIRENKYKFEHYEDTIEFREWFTTTMIANELGISAIQLNWFLMDEGIQSKIDGEWMIAREFRHLRDYHIYKWYNPKTKYTNKYKIESWTGEGRKYIIERWKKVNG